MKDKTPTNLAEWTERAARNCYVTGFGLDVASVTACPFCAAPDFRKDRAVSFQEDASREATCKECGRSSKLVFTRSGPSVSFEIVQTGGDDPPEWLEPAPRRIDR